MKKLVIAAAAGRGPERGRRARPSARRPSTRSPDAEKKQGWVLLFNGKDFDGWRQCNNTTMPANWVIEDQAMKVFTAAGQEAGPGLGRRRPLRREEVQQLRAVDRLEDREGRQLRHLLQRARGAREAHLLRRARGAGARQRGRHRQQDRQPPRRVALRHAAGRPEDREARRRVEHDRHPREGRQGHAHAERREGGRVRAVDARSGTRWSRTASSRRSRASPRASRRKATSASRTTATPSGSGTSRSGNCRGRGPSGTRRRRRAGTASRCGRPTSACAPSRLADRGLTRDGCRHAAWRTPGPRRQNRQAVARRRLKPEG